MFHALLDYRPRADREMEFMLAQVAWTQATFGPVRLKSAKISDFMQITAAQQKRDPEPVNSAAIWRMNMAAIAAALKARG